MKSLLAKSKKMKNKKGFTLIELIVVIVIIGILAAIIVPRLTGFSDSAHEAACEANRKTFETAAAAMYAENGSYPTIAQLEASEYIPAGTSAVCPEDGTTAYTIDANGVISCANHP